MAKAVRWVGAFRKRGTLTAALHHELSVVQGREAVAVEPLTRGKSRIRHARVGLRVNVTASRFRGGWLCDAYTERDDQGRIRQTRRRVGKPIRNWHQLARLLAAGAGDRGHKRILGVYSHHAEAIFVPQYDAIVVCGRISPAAWAQVKEISALYMLPIVKEVQKA